MGRKAIDLNPEMGKRLSAWLDEVKMKQLDLANLVGYTQQYISKVVTGKQNMSVDLANAISEKVPKLVYNPSGEVIGIEHVLPQWLLCLTDKKTDCAQTEFEKKKRNYRFEAEWSLLGESARRYGYSIVQHAVAGLDFPDYDLLLNNQDKRNWFGIERDGNVVLRLSPQEFIALEQKLEKFSDFIIFDLLSNIEGDKNG